MAEPNEPSENAADAVTHLSKSQDIAVPDVDVGKVLTIEPRSIGTVRRLTIEEKRENSASWVASLITITFMASALMLLAGIYSVTLRKPEEAKALLDAALPAVKEAGSFLSTVFGPLLAFILGYYFSEKNRFNASGGQRNEPPPL